MEVNPVNCKCARFSVSHPPAFGENKWEREKLETHLFSHRQHNPFKLTETSAHILKRTFIAPSIVLPQSNKSLLLVILRKTMTLMTMVMIMTMKMAVMVVMMKMMILLVVMMMMMMMMTRRK